MIFLISVYAPRVVIGFVARITLGDPLDQSLTSPIFHSVHSEVSFVSCVKSNVWSLARMRIYFDKHDAHDARMVLLIVTT